MFILMTKKNVKRIILGIKIFSLILLLTFAVTELYRLYNQYDFNNKMWLKDDNPSGNPLKVQNKGILVNKKETGDEKAKLLNKVKDDLQYFYKGENGVEKR